MRAVVFRAVLLRVGDFRAVERDDDFFVRDFAACSGLPLRLVEANSSSCFSLIDLYMLRDAPLSLLGLVFPRLAESAAPLRPLLHCRFGWHGGPPGYGYANEQRAFAVRVPAP